MSFDLRKWLAFFFMVIALILLLLLMAGCGTEKKLLREKSKTDSSTISNLQTENRSLKQENTRLESELRQAQYAGVIFDSTPCPPVNTPAIVVDGRCNVDSVKQALQAFYGSLFESRVKVYADGTIEARGRLKSANYTLLMQQRIIAEKDSRIDSFATALASEKKNVKTVDVVVEKEKKRSWPWLLFIFCFLAGIAFWHRFGYQVKLFLKHIFTKWK